MPQRKKNKQPTYGGFVPIPREVLLLLKRGDFENLAVFGAWIAILLSSRFSDNSQGNRHSISDEKMAEKAGFDRSSWYRHRKSLKRLGLMADEKNDDYDSDFPWWSEWYVNFHDGAFVQHNDAKMHERAEDAHKRSAILNKLNPILKIDGIPESDFHKQIKSDDVADPQHKEKSLETLREKTKRNPLKNPSIIRQGRKLTESLDCKKCGGYVSYPQREFSLRQTKQIYCGKCFPNPYSPYSDTGSK
jgi:hypothetical protein